MISATTCNAIFFVGRPNEERFTPLKHALWNINVRKGTLKVIKIFSAGARSVSKTISRATTYRKKILHSESAPYIYTKRKTRCDALSDDTQKLMYNVWCSPENSHPTGNLHLSNTRCETLMFGKALWKSWNTSVWVFSRICTGCDEYFFGA
jgi:hypothetical protein